MRIKTVLNRVHKVKRFVYEKVRFDGDEIEVEVRPRAGSRPICSGCGQRGPGYDTLDRRRFTYRHRRLGRYLRICRGEVRRTRTDTATTSAGVWAAMTAQGVASC